MMFTFLILSLYWKYLLAQQQCRPDIAKPACAGKQRVWSTCVMAVTLDFALYLLNYLAIFPHNINLMCFSVRKRLFIPVSVGMQ